MRFLSSLFFLLIATPVFANSPIIPAISIVVAPVETGAVPQGATRVPMLSLAIQNSCDAKNAIRYIRFWHTGLGAASDIKSVYLMNGDKRVSRAAVVPRNGFVTVRLQNMTMDACENVSLVLMADMNADAATGSEHRFELRKEQDINATTKTLFLTQSPVPAVRITPGTQGSVNVEYLPQLTSILYGSKRTLLRMRLSAEGSDVLISSITLTNDGKARDADLKNLFLGTHDARFSNMAATMDGDTVTFTFDPPLLIEKGDDRLLQLTGDVRASRKQTIDFSVEEPGDIVAQPRKGRSDTFQ